MAAAASTRPDYGIDAPHVMRNLFLAAVACLLVFAFVPNGLRIWIFLFPRPAFLYTGLILLAQALLYLFYVRRGKLLHRDRILALYPWHGEEQVLDVGCGRGLLLAGVARRLTRGHATGIDLWSNEDMGANSAAATQRNLELEGLQDRATVETMNAAGMYFPDASFDVVVSNLCLHNIYDKPTRKEALAHIARVLRPGGTALLSDYKLTGEYADYLAAHGFTVRRLWGAWYNFPALRIVVARKAAL